MKKSIFAMSVFAFLFSCSHGGLSRKIQIGMSKLEVVRVAGQPTGTMSDSGADVLFFRDEWDRSCVVEFRQSKVSAPVSCVYAGEPERGIAAQNPGSRLDVSDKDRSGP
jgi:hypothetical protein